MNREKLTRGFLWFSIYLTAIGLGAKIFDLVVVAGAWGASPPESLSLMPYGPRYPVDPGTFFQPLSALMLLGILGALFSGWKTPYSYRIWLIIPVVAFVVIWILTPTIFWPMIRELYGLGTGRLSTTHDAAVALVRNRVIWDWIRVSIIAIVLFAQLRAISVPYASRTR